MTTALSALRRPHNLIILVLVATLMALLAGPVATAGRKNDYIRHVAPEVANPLIATGVTIEKDARIYKSSGIGPAALNPGATRGTPEAYVDVEQFPGGTLPAGATITEAQGINVLRQIQRNLGERGLTGRDVVTMRVFLDNAPGTDRADYDGWNRAYRQFFANTDLQTGKVILVPLGTGTPAKPLVRNATRPSRFALEVASLPVSGWLVEVEVDAVYRR